MRLFEIGSFFAMASTADGGSPWLQLVPFALVLGIFYFIILLPMRRRQKKVDEFISSLKVGDKVVTTGGFGLLLCIAFRTFQYAPPFDSVAMARVYAAFTLLFFAFCAYAIFGLTRSATSAQA